MEEQIQFIIEANYDPDGEEMRGKEAAAEITDHFKKFILWKDDLHCPFIVHYNGEDSTRPKISYDKGNKNFTLDEVYEFWQNSL